MSIYVPKAEKRMGYIQKHRINNPVHKQQGKIIHLHFSLN